MTNPTRTGEDITTGLMALIAWAGNASAASRYLKSEKGLALAPATLSAWKTKHAIEYDELREKWSGQLEGNLAHEMRDVARLSVETERLAIEKARTRLVKGEDQDPGRTASNLARVTQSSIDKLLSLTGRPTQITENRDATEILRRLVSMGVLQLPDEPKQIVEEVGDA